MQKLQTSVDLLHGKFAALGNRRFAQEAQTNILMQRKIIEPTEKPRQTDIRRLFAGVFIRSAICRG